MAMLSLAVIEGKSLVITPLEERYSIWKFIRVPKKLSHPVFTLDLCNNQGWTPRPAGNPPRGEGGVPRPAPRCGEGGVPRPAPPRKNDQNRGEVAGQNKGPNLNFLQ